MAILDAALPLFAADGYGATSIARVAAAAGVAKPVLYDHFASKQALYGALVDRESRLAFEALAASHDPNAPLEARLRSLALTAVAYARRHGHASRLLLQSPVGDPAVAAAHERARGLGRRTIAAAILADPVFEASPGLSRRDSAELLGDLHGALLERLVGWAVEHPHTPASALAELLVDVLWTGLSSD